MPLTTQELRKLKKYEALPASELSEARREKLHTLKRQRDSEDDAKRSNYGSQKHHKNAVAESGQVEPPPKKPKPTKSKATVDSSSSRLCKDCENKFSFDDGAASWYAEKGFAAPERCPVCVAAKKTRFEAKEAKKHLEKETGAIKKHRCFNCGGKPHDGGQCPLPDQRGAPPACYTCSSPDHLTRNCPSVKPKMLKGGCYVCGHTDHISADCTEPRPPPFCFNCGRDGHTARACEKPPREPGNGPCFAFSRGKCTRAKKCKFVHDA
jgi:hypothetical protein